MKSKANAKVVDTRVEDARKARDVKYADFLRTGMVLLKKTRLGLFPRLVWGSKDSSSNKYNRLCWIKPKYLVSQEDIPSASVMLSEPPPVAVQKLGKAPPPPLPQSEPPKSTALETKGLGVAAADISETALAHIERTALCSTLFGASIGSVLPAKNARSLCFVIRTKEGEKYKFEAPSLDVRTQWVNALRWLQEGCSEVSTPSGVVHVTHVNQDMDWSSSISSETLEQEFEFGRMLGYGAFGQVYKATHKASGHILAIKTVLVDPTFMSTEEIRAEVDTLKLSKHECIVNYFGCWGPDSGNRLWMLMEFCAGGSVVDTFIKHKLQLSERQIAHACACTLRALAYLQTQKIIHRDVKGRNILLGAEGDIKLTDFGVAKCVLPLDPTKPRTADEAIGTPHWMAPELLEKTKISSVNLWKADVWSLGITAIELAEGDPPLQALGGEELVETILRSPPPGLAKPDEWSPIFRDFIKRCLTVDPTLRPDAVLLLKHPFFSDLQDTTITPKEIMANLIYSSMYASYKKQKFSLRGGNQLPPSRSAPIVDARHPSAANTHIEEPYDKGKEKDRKILKKLMKQQVKRDISAKAMWQNNKTSNNNKTVETSIQMFSSLLAAAIITEQKRKEKILFERSLTSFEAVVLPDSQKKSNQNMYQITTKIYSVTDLDDIKAYTVHRKFSDFEKLRTQLEQQLRYNCVPFLASAGAVTEEKKRKQTQYFLDYIARHKLLALSGNVTIFLQGTEQEWKECQSLTKQQKQEQEKLDNLASKGQNLTEKQLKEITPPLPISPVLPIQQYCTKIEMLTQKLTSVCDLLFRYAQSASKSWLVFAECRNLLYSSVLSPLSPSVTNKLSTNHKRGSTLSSSSSTSLSSSTSTGSSSFSPASSKVKEDEKKAPRELKGGIFSKPITSLIPKSRLERSVSAVVSSQGPASSSSPTDARVRTKTASSLNVSQSFSLENEFAGLTATQEALVPMHALLSELPSIAVLHQYASERARKTICDRLEQHQTLAKCMQEMCKRAEPTVFAYYAMQAQLNKSKSKTMLGVGGPSMPDQSLIEGAWTEMGTRVSQELNTFTQTRRAETFAAMTAFVKDEVIHEKKMTAVFEHLLRELEK